MSPTSPARVSHASRAPVITCAPAITHHFLFGAQHSQFPKAHMKRRTLVGPVLLPYDHHVDAARQRGLVDALIQLLHRHQHLTCQLSHIVHGVYLLRDMREGEKKKKKRRSAQISAFFQSVSPNINGIVSFITKNNFLTAIKLSFILSDSHKRVIRSTYFTVTTTVTDFPIPSL